MSRPGYPREVFVASEALVCKETGLMRSTVHSCRRQTEGSLLSEDRHLSAGTDGVARD